MYAIYFIFKNPVNYFKRTANKKWRVILLQTFALIAICRGQMLAELKKLDISPENIEGIEMYTDLSIDEIITQALGGIDRKYYQYTLNSTELA